MQARFALDLSVTHSNRILTFFSLYYYFICFIFLQPRLKFPFLLWINNQPTRYFSSYKQVSFIAFLQCVALSQYLLQFFFFFYDIILWCTTVKQGPGRRKRQIKWTQSALLFIPFFGASNKTTHLQQFKGSICFIRASQKGFFWHNQSQKAFNRPK